MIIVDTSQGAVKIDVPPDVRKVAVKLSGGADSAVLAYMLGLYKLSVRDIELCAVTVVNESLPHQHIISGRVYRWINGKLGGVYGEHIIKPDYVKHSRYSEEQREFVRLLRKSGKFDVTFNGITENPDVDLDPDRKFVGAVQQSREKSLGRKPEVSEKKNSFSPFANVNKRAIRELYEHYGLMDNLFPITRSCENWDFHHDDYHCGDRCWWCLERMWGFGRLE